MGVFGLMSHCLQRKKECMQEIDLVKVAQEKGGIQLLVDFYSFEHLLMRNFWKSLSACSGNSMLRLLGGEYGAIDAFVTKIIKDLRALDIELVMFIDGAKGSSKKGTEQKLDTWKSRHFKDMQKLYELLDVLCGGKDMQEVKDEVSVRPVLLEIQILQSLKSCECEVVQLASGEADYVLAKNLQLRPKAFAILSNDSDFCIFENCCFIPNEMFDLKQDLQLGSSKQWLPEKPLRLECGVISTEKVIKMLELDNHDQLIDIAVVMGTDFTNPYALSVKRKIGFRNKGTISEAASWIREHGRADNHPAFTKEIKYNSDFAAAVEHSRQFYRLVAPADQDHFKGDYSQLLVDGIQAGQYPANLMSMHLNFYWHRMLLEDCSRGCPSIECALAPLRSAVYRIILPRQERTVVEYGRTAYEEFDSNVVYAADPRGLQSLDYINKEKIFKNLRTFHSILTHQEPHNPVNYFDKYGRRSGFNLLILRYFLLLNAGHHLDICLDEFLAIFAMVFCKVNEPWYCGLCIKPTVRCITMGNWFLDLYRHAFSFVGTLLHLTHEFPLPKDLFSGAVFTAFYMSRMHSQQFRSMGFPEHWLQQINKDMKYIIDEKKHIIENVVAGIFQFNTRYR